MAKKKDAIECGPLARQKLRELPLAGKRADDDLATFTKALAHPARIQILRLLVERNSCICGEIVGEIDLAQSTVSQHLKVLKDAGLIRGTIDGPKSCYCIDPEVVRRFKLLVAAI